MIHAKMAFVISLLSTFQGINPEGGTQGGSCITSRRLHPHIFERPLVSQPGIHDTVESNTACHAQVICMCYLVEPIDKLQSGFFEHNLQRMGNVIMALLQWPALHSRRPKPFLKRERLYRVLTV